MTAHLMHRGLDAEYPATLSRKIIGGLLRDQLGFRGVVLTDDMGMKAITDHFGQEHAIELAINAGADVLVFGNNNVNYDPDITPHVFAMIKHLVATGRVSEARIQEANERIARAKQHLR